jgi:hypothetical protein
MEPVEYVVTLHRGVDMQQFYDDMETHGGDACVPDRCCEVCRRRPISRNTHYYLTDQEAADLEKDPRVIAVMMTPDKYGAFPKPVYNPYTITNETFRKDGTFVSTDRSWAHLHCAGDDTQRRKGSWGSGTVTDTVSVFGDGAGVDVIIVDSAMSYDHVEWLSPSKGTTRFVQYQWLNELNQYVTSIDDDSRTPQTGTIQYLPSNNNSNGSHGTHVGGTVAGARYGWANEATIYNLDIFGDTPLQGGGVFDPPTLLIFDYLRAFHRHKGNNRPTITNHSWGYSTDWTEYLGTYFINSFNQVNWIDVDDGQGNVTRYSESNPPARGWDAEVVCQDIGLDGAEIPYDYPAIRADVEDAIEDGVVVIGAAGNENYYCHSTVNKTRVQIDTGTSGTRTAYAHRGMSPNNAAGVINVGALKHTDDFRRTDFSNYGPMIDVFAPGEEIVSAWIGSTTAFNEIRGTSMASPQVAGVAACLASGKTRFTNKDVLAYIKNHCKHDDMGFDLGGPPDWHNTPGDFCDVTCQKGSPNTYLLATSPRPATGFTSPNVGDRESQPQAYPRPSTMFRT